VRLLAQAPPLGRVPIQHLRRPEGLWPRAHPTAAAIECCSWLRVAGLLKPASVPPAKASPVDGGAEPCDCPGPAAVGRRSVCWQSAEGNSGSSRCCPRGPVLNSYTHMIDERSWQLASAESGVRSAGAARPSTRFKRGCLVDSAPSTVCPGATTPAPGRRPPADSTMRRWPPVVGDIIGVVLGDLDCRRAAVDGGFRRVPVVGSSRSVHRGHEGPRRRSASAGASRRLDRSSPRSVTFSSRSLTVSTRCSSKHSSGDPDRYAHAIDDTSAVTSVRRTRD